MMPGGDLCGCLVVRVEAVIVERLDGQGERPVTSMRVDAAGSGDRRRHRRGARVVDVVQARHLTAPARLPASSPILVHAVLVHTAQAVRSHPAVRVLSRVQSCPRARCTGHGIMYSVGKLLRVPSFTVLAKKRDEKCRIRPTIADIMECSV